MSEIQVKDKLITLEELGTAINAKAGVTSVNNQTGAVSITPENIGAPTTTGSGASGTWNINIPFSGVGTTGFKSFTLNEINIDNTSGNWVAGFSDRTNHGTFPTWNVWWTIVRQYESAGFFYQVANQLDNIGQTAYMSVRVKWESGSWGSWIDIINKSAAPVTSGGTGATTSAVTITNDYSSVLNVINAVKGTRIFPISIQKNQMSSYSDMPSGNETDEWNLLLVGDSTRLTANLYIFKGGQNPKMYLRHFYNGAWLCDWTQVV